MLRLILTYGVLAGLMVGVPLSIMTVWHVGPEGGALGMAVGYLIMLVALSMIFVAIKRFRDVDQGGVIGFWQGFAIGLGISVVAGIFYVVAWESAVAITGMDFGAVYSKSMIEQAKASGMSGARLARYTAEMQAFRVSYANPLYRWPMTFVEIFPVGVLVSLISAALLRNRRFLPARATPLGA